MKTADMCPQGGADALDTNPDASWFRFAPAAMLVAIVTAAFVAYHNTLSLPFVFDDQVVVVDNTTIRQLWPLSDVLATPRDGSGAAGRPLLNLTFALNYAWGGLAVEGYHVVNLLLHTASALLLFGLVRRTLLRPAFAGRFAGSAAWIGFVSALLWTVHPLNTESVTCVAQRTELLVAFFYLLTLYAFVRATEVGNAARWRTLAVAACLLGMASKEVMATAPLLVLLYDRTFVGGTFRAAWQQRRDLHLSLMSTWLLLGWIVLGMGGSRGEAAGFGLGVTPWSYALKQCEAILHYLRLCFWPNPLVVDYGTDVIHSARDVWPQGVSLLLLLAVAAFALVRRPKLGFLGAWFFVILGPSSSFVPLVGQTMAEHRMYLPLIAVVVAVAIAAQRWLGTWGTRGLILPVTLGVAVTVQRNTIYQSEIGLWQETARLRPDNPRAHLCYGLALRKAHQPDEAVAPLLQVLLLDPTHSTAHNTLGQIFAARGWMQDAVEHYEIALEGRDNHAALHSNLCDALRALGRLPEALQHGRDAVRLDPKLAAAHGNLALVLAALGQDADALVSYEAAVQLDPGIPSVRNNFGVALMNAGRLAEAREHLDAAVRLAPEMAVAHNSRGALLDRLGERDAARREFSEALRLDPMFEGARTNLAALESGAIPPAATL